MQTIGIVSNCRGRRIYHLRVSGHIDNATCLFVDIFVFRCKIYTKGFSSDRIGLKHVDARVQMTITKYVHPTAAADDCSRTLSESSATGVDLASGFMLCLQYKSSFRYTFKQLSKTHVHQNIT